MREDYERLADMNHEGVEHISWSEGGGGMVHKIWNVWILFEVPQYGGTPQFVKAFGPSEIREMLDLAASWT